ncbi:uncharacterized protein LTR77_005701 [Saxophila tyrrhenica]|uniref:Cytochrome P450 n=1 Tax=Saxophila tyrrhenica TaxID=1690608 RepID=A0AAV9P9N8_9PEZI|nr:hypothetical protein LTR77_005701 [Saxophila tyrrhenica]
MAASTTQTALSLLTVRNVFFSIIAYFVLSWAGQIIRYRFFSPIRDFPGPFWASVTRLWIAYHNLKEDECETELALHKKYGPVLRITPTMLLVSDATKLPEVYARNANKSKYYVTGSFGKTESLFNMQEHRVHAHYRKIAAGPYAFSNIKKMEPLVDARMKDWMDKMEENFADTGKKFDFAPWAVFMAYDIISEIGFGAPIGFIEQGKDVDGLIQGFHDGLPAFGLLGRLWPFTYSVTRTFSSLSDGHDVQVPHKFNVHEELRSAGIFHYDARHCNLRTEPPSSVPSLHSESKQHISQIHREGFTV